MVRLVLKVQNPEVIARFFIVIPTIKYYYIYLMIRNKDVITLLLSIATHKGFYTLLKYNNCIQDQYHT